MKEQYEASYTIEAAVVISIVLFSLITIIQGAYELCQRTAGMNRLHEKIEAVRHKEYMEENAYEYEDQFGQLRLHINKKGKEVTGIVSGYGVFTRSNWNGDIKSHEFDPENWIRGITVISDFLRDKGEK